jgi:hypothetical protein
VAWSIGLVLVCGALVTLGARVVADRGDSGHRPTPPVASHDLSRQAPLGPDGKPYRAFTGNSWWNAPVPADAPHNPHEAAILGYLQSAPQSDQGCLRLAGAHDNRWGQPVYWAQPGDVDYDVQGLPPGRPPETRSLRIPPGAEPADNSDGSLVVYDMARGYVAMLTDAKFDAPAGQWSASGATVTYLDSNGLHAATNKSNNPHNTGTHRGNNGATTAVRLDMVRAGEIRNVLKIASGPELANRWVFPMTGSDGDYDGNDPAVPPEGLRLRIKPSVNLDQLGLHPQALVIAKAIQKYGVYLGDSGGATALKLEDTRTEGRGQLWDVTTEDLCSLPFSPAYWDVLPEGYDPSGH